MKYSGWMDSKSQLDDRPAKAAGNVNTDREERLLRFVDILRAEQIRASIRADTEGGGTSFRRWRGLALFLVVVVIAIGAAAAFLKAPGPSPVRPNAEHDSAVGTASVQAAAPAHHSQSAPAQQIAPSRAPESVPEPVAPTAGPVTLNPNPPVAGVLSSSNALPPGSAPAQQGAAVSPNTTGPTVPPAAVAARPDTVEPLAPSHEADALAASPPIRADTEVSEPETTKPVLFVYYPKGSLRAKATARILATRIGSEVTISDIKAATGLPNDAIIKFSEGRNHERARMIGKSLGRSGYRWRIEKTPTPVGSHRNMIEVWLPKK
ncbi:hypothetical protein [Acidisphaera sp. S103]|uniref:hypothetical protein n=1 Tax=Acidisphaera sp. S103 TaxID=1747223 RepID=UPI00131A90FB|nr:hypothetical protein [Acidisphaera sp. S103]